MPGESLNNFSSPSTHSDMTTITGGTTPHHTAAQLHSQPRVLTHIHGADQSTHQTEHQMMTRQQHCIRRLTAADEAREVLAPRSGAPAVCPGREDPVVPVKRGNGRVRAVDELLAGGGGAFGRGFAVQLEQHGCVFSELAEVERRECGCCCDFSLWRWRWRCKRGLNGPHGGAEIRVGNSCGK